MKEQRMRIAYVAVCLPFAEGGDEFFISEAREILNLGHDLLIVPRIPTKPPVDETSISLLSHTRAQPLLSWEILKGVVSEFLRSPARCISALSLMFRSRDLMTFVKNLAVFPKGLWLSKIVREWKADHIHVQWAGTTATMGLIASEVSGIPWSFTAHRADIVLQNLLAIKVEKAVFARFISESGLSIVRDMGLTLQFEKCRVLHMGVDVPADLPDRIPRKRKIVLCPANITAVKGQKHLIDAVAVLKKRGSDPVLLFAGKGFESKDGATEGAPPSKAVVTKDPIFMKTAASLKKQAESLGLEDDIRFLGHVSHQTLLSFYEKGLVDCVVIPSIDMGGGLHEGIPVSLMEAMANGVPVISTLTGGIKELLGDGAGILVPPGDPAALADAIGLMLTDEGVWKRYSIAGRERIIDEFSVKKVVGELCGLIARSGSGGTE